MTPDFDWIRHSPFPDPEWSRFRFHSISDMLQCVKSDDESQSPILAGIVSGQEAVVTLLDLQLSAANAEEWRVRQNIPRGSRILLLRLPYASELVVAVHAISLMAAGVSVVLPTNSDPLLIAELIERTGCRHVLFPVEEDVRRNHSAATDAVAGIRRLLAERDIQECSLPVKFPLNRDIRSLCDAMSSEHEVDVKHDVDAEVLVLTTSSTTGRPKLVRYSERSLLTVGESWQIAGLLEDQTTGGTSLCPLLSHSMGMRNVLHAIRTRRVTLLIPPEWLAEAPHCALRLLQAWPPQHFTGGPALIQAVAELSRSSPEASKALRSLRIVVSSGSCWDVRARNAFPGVRLANAFGMTETQQVLSTLIPGNLNCRHTDESGDGLRTLGRPLPGVSVAIRFTDPKNLAGRLFVKSAFRAIGYVGEPAFAEWFDTGDDVRIIDNELEYAGRAATDFINLGSGLKVSITEIADRYARLSHQFRGLIFRQSAGRMGVVAIAFCGDRDPACRKLHEETRESVSSRHDELTLEGNDFELRHTQLVAVGFVAGAPPGVGPGKVDRNSIERDHGALLNALDSAAGRHSHMVEISEPDLRDDAWYQHLSPLIGRFMEATKLDVEFTDGKGDHLYRSVDGQRCEVLDLVGGYGSNLLGHGRSDLQAVAIEAMQRIPLLDQGSRRRSSALLARILSSRFGSVTGRRYVCLLHSTGAEAVEAALKHALLKWRSDFRKFNREIQSEFGILCPELARQCIEHNEKQADVFRPLLLALEGGYHGKTAGALNVMSDKFLRTPFSALLGARVRFIPREDLISEQPALQSLWTQEALILQHPTLQKGRFETGQKAISGIMALIAEPVQGEGGVFEVPLKWLKAVREAGIPMILDEIQCGLGRTGQFPASRGVVADYYLVGKSLGGGIAKISATLIDQTVYCDDFDLQNGATFSGDAFSSRVAIKALEIMETDHIADRAAEIGKTLRDQLETLRKSHPESIRTISGRGAMFGIQLAMPAHLNRFLKALMRERFGYFAASFLLHRHNIRVFPTMSAPLILRIEPSAYLQAEDIERLVTALDEFCHLLAADHVPELIDHLIPKTIVSGITRDASGPGSASRASVSPRRLQFRFEHEPPTASARRVGFVFNFIYPSDELLVAMPQLIGLTVEQRAELVWRFQILAQQKPVELFSRNLFGGRVWLSGILLPVTPEVLAHLHHTGKQSQLQMGLNQALDCAVAQGCETVVFGAQTSVVTRDATTLLPPAGVQVASGNTFTVAAMLTQIDKACNKKGILPDGRLAVVGAAGNIGSAIVRWFAQRGRWKGPIIIMGRPGTHSRLNDLRNSLSETSTAESLLVADDRSVLSECDVIIVAISGAGVALQSSDISATRDVVIADVSQPRGIAATMTQDRPNAEIVWAGLVSLPEDPLFRMSPHTSRGKCFACAAEAILMGLEPQPFSLSGPIDLQAVETLQRLGQKYGML